MYKNGFQPSNNTIKEFPSEESDEENCEDFRNIIYNNDLIAQTYQNDQTNQPRDNKNYQNFKLDLEEKEEEDQEEQEQEEEAEDEEGEQEFDQNAQEDEENQDENESAENSQQEQQQQQEGDEDDVNQIRNNQQHLDKNQVYAGTQHRQLDRQENDNQQHHLELQAQQLRNIQAQFKQYQDQNFIQQDVDEDDEEEQQEEEEMIKSKNINMTKKLIPSSKTDKRPMSAKPKQSVLKSIPQPVLQQSALYQRATNNSVVPSTSKKNQQQKIVIPEDQYCDEELQLNKENCMAPKLKHLNRPQTAAPKVINNKSGLYDIPEAPLKNQSTRFPDKQKLKETRDETAREELQRPKTASAFKPVYTLSMNELKMRSQQYDYKSQNFTTVIKKSDPVSRYQNMRKSWGSSKFLSSSTSTPGMAKEGRKLQLCERIASSKPESIFHRYLPQNPLIV